MARLELLVLDFDGTFTRVDDEAAPFLVAYRAGLAAVLGEPVDEAWERARRTIEADPDRYGWEHEGRIVAPAHADPYILATTIAQLLLAERGLDRTVTERLYREAYAKAGIAFRHDAREVVEAALDTGVPVFVVTNSRTTDVVAKIARLEARGSERLVVRGDACKWMITAASRADPRFDALPDEQHVPGLRRPILLKRGRYFDTLATLWAETGASPEGTLVCGDIYELDLALPAALGARVHMVGRPSTPEYERAAVLRAGGTFSLELSGLLPALA
ncbi:MAG TPA: hypothetical protein VIL20_21055 [Sandaracinaceae bacterium]